MRSWFHHALILLAVLLVSVATGAAQQAAPPACGKPPAIMQSTAPNIFSEQQEQWLGEAMADHNDSFSKPIKDPALNAYLNAVGARLLANLPPTEFKFQFRLVESSEINGFSLAGGRVYLTRKLVASAHNEDEIAGVIGHEMGHILTHQFAIETTSDFKRLLGITSVGDRADIFAKYQKLLDAQLKDKHPIDPDSDVNQDAADRVAVYAVAAAGYRPQAYAEFWDRSFFVNGKTGSGLSDFFHQTTPTQKRLRRIRGIIAELPSDCALTATENASAEFKQWQHAVIEDQAAAVTAGSDSSSDVTLTPPLHLDIDYLHFSRDGKYALAQDENSVFVLSHSPFQEIFRFDADNALPAQFTPDSQNIVFTTPGLHVETWNIAQKKLVSAREVVAQQSCFQVMLAPDGNTIYCPYVAGDGAISLSLLDVGTGKVVFEKKHWFEPNSQFSFSLLVSRYLGQVEDFVTTSVSPDGNTLLTGPGQFRLALDLRTRTPIKLGGALQDSYFGNSYYFSGNDKVVLFTASATTKSGTFSFPEGKRIETLPGALPWARPTTGSDLVVTRGPEGTPLALADVHSGKYVVGVKNEALDVLQETLLSETVDGSLALFPIHSTDAKAGERTRLSQSPLAGTRTIAFSPDGRYVAVSGRSRGGVWDIQSGKQATLIRGFSHAWWNSQGDLYVQFYARDKDHPAVMGLLNPHKNSSKYLTYKLPDETNLLRGHLLELKSQKKTATLTAYSPADLSVQWTREFDEGQPAYTVNTGNEELIFSYFLQSPPAKEILRSDSSLKAEADGIKQKQSGRLIEVINSADGKVTARAIVEVPLTYQGVNGFDRVGDQLYLSVGDNRTIVYSLATGAQVRQIFGHLVAADQTTGIICTFNRRDETIVSDKTGAELQHLALPSPLRFARLENGGTQLTVLTADQHVRHYAISRP
jgi:WD40 repeat protein